MRRTRLSNFLYCIVRTENCASIACPWNTVDDKLAIFSTHISLGTNSSMFANCSVFYDVRHVRSLVLGQNMMFESVWSLVLLLCDQTSLGTYSLMFANCSVFCDVRHVRSSVFGQNVMFGIVRSLVLLLCDQTNLGKNNLMFTNC